MPSSVGKYRVVDAGIAQFFQCLVCELSFISLADFNDHWNDTIYKATHIEEI